MQWSLWGYMFMGYVGDDCWKTYPSCIPTDSGIAGG